MNFQFKFREYSKALYYALKEDAFYITMERSVPDTESSKEALLRYLDYSMVEGKKYGELFIPNKHDYGVSVWSKPLSCELQAQRAEEKKCFLFNYMGQESLRIYEDVVGIMSKNAAPVIDKNSWYLSIVGVLPEFQGKGLGSKLVSGVLEKSDMLEIPTYLETFTPRNITFYERLGYQVVGSFHEPTIQANYWLMARKCIHA